MKKIFVILITLFISVSAFSQDDYADLLIIKADGNWEKLIKKAEQYTLSNKTKKDPEPYYYLTYGLYKISFDAERGDKYKNAYKDAFTSIGKMMQYDKSGEITEKYAEFIDELKLSIFELIQNDLDNDDYRRAFGWVMRLYKFGRSYTPVYFLEAPLRYRNGDASTARIKWQAGKELLEKEDVSSYGKADSEILMMGLYQSAKVLKENLQKDMVKEMLDIGEKYFKDNETWGEYYEELTE